ncbi:hypothetical protein ACFFGH_26295 [Lysobacter korlensis]|uniref:Uncharacterized protein n=1 Tax=Lysobacter korlensis TaxID=553636 RepID=A0ABV6RY10_9GAMM
MTTRAETGQSAQVDQPDPVYGAGATGPEKNLARVAGVTGAVLTVGSVGVAAPDAWTWWQYAVAAVLAFDLIGGVVANGLNSAKRDHFAAPGPAAGWLGRLVRRPVLFAAVHIQPILIGLLFPGAAWWWGAAWYLIALLTVALVRVTPLYLQRPVALFCCTVVAVLAPLSAAPFGLWWVPVIMVLKLTLAHAVQEEPYRPEGR